MTNAESFRALLQSDAALSAKFEEIATAYIEEASAAGISIRADDLCEIAAVRLHTMVGEPSGDWLAEAHAKLPAFKKAEAERLAFEAILDTQHERHNEEAERIAALKPADRVSHARMMGATATIMKGSQTKRDLSPEETAAAVAQVEQSGLRGSAKIQLARQLGLA